MKTPFAPPANAIVWAEIPVTNLARAKSFYSAVTGVAMKDEQMGPNVTVVFGYAGNGGVAGHLYEGKPAAPGSGPTVHLSLPDSLEAGLERVKRAGGKVVSPVIDIPAGRFAYCQDPDGNSLGLFTR